MSTLKIHISILRCTDCLSFSVDIEKQNLLWWKGYFGETLGMFILH